MKTKPFSASEYKPTDKLVCGGDPVTELIIGTDFVAGVRQDGAFRGIGRWSATTGVCYGVGDPLEVLIPEPDKPRIRQCPFCGGIAHLVNSASDEGQPTQSWVTCGECNAESPSGCDGGDYAIAHWNRRAIVREVTEPTPERDETLSTKPDSQGWVPLHNGVPIWRFAAITEHEADLDRAFFELTGPVVPCIVFKPMTREEAAAIVDRHFTRWLTSNQWRDQVIDAILESHNGRAEGV